MECPNCKHATNDTALLQCSHCGEAFERGPLEEFQHLEYLAEWLKDQPKINQLQLRDLLISVEEKRSKLLTQLLPKPKEKEILETEPVMDEAQVVSPVPVSTASPLPAQPVIAPVHKPVAPPKPKRPPMDWKKVREQLADAVTSGALLRALLYLGAFMIVISATVLVIRFWDQFPPVLQVVFIASVPLMFYSGGWLLRSRLKLEQGGTVLTGIGAILVAVDFAAIYQFGGLAEQVNGPVYWLIVSLFCTALYSFTAWRLKGEFFDYLTLFSGASILVALTRLPTPKLSFEWTVVTITFSGMVMTVLAGRFWNKSDVWRDFARASRYLAQVLIPASVFYVMFSLAALPIMSAFLMAMIGYTVLAWTFPNIIFAYSALIASIGAVIFGLRGADVQAEWYALAASVMAFVYILVGRGIQKVKAESGIIQNYVKALNTMGFILTATGAASGFIIAFTEVWAGVLAMTMAVLDLVVCANFFKHSRYTFFASCLFIAPFTFAFWQWFKASEIPQPLGWLAVMWVALALAYTGLGVLLRKSEGGARWLHLLAHGLTLFALGILPLEYAAVSRPWNYIPSSTTLGLSILVYLISTLLHDSAKHPALSNLVNRLPFGVGKSIFLWFAGFLLPVWVAVGWFGNELNKPWFGAVLAGMGILYIGIGQGLARRFTEYRLPFHVYSYFLFVIGILVAMPDPSSSAVPERYPLLVALAVTFISLGLVAYIYNRVIETTLASLVFIWLFALSLWMLNIPQQAHGFAFIVLAAWVYTPVGMLLDKIQKGREGHHPLPVFVIGYALSLYAILNSVYWNVQENSLPWVGAVTPLIASALYIFSTFYHKNNKFLCGAFAWASVITFAVTFRQGLTLFKSPDVYSPLAWTVFAALYMIVERVFAHVILSRGTAKNLFNGMGDSSLPSAAQNDTMPYWLAKFHLPLITGWIVLAALGLSLSLPDTFVAFSGGKLTTYLPFIVAQAALVLILLASAWMYRTRIPLYIEPAIAFLPATLFFVGYAGTLFSKSLTTPQYALVWTGLGIVHVVAAIFTDRSKERYSHGLYLGGYALLLLALVFSTADRLVNIEVLAATILVAVASHLLVHYGRHQTIEDFINTFFQKADNTIRRIVSTMFAFYAAYTFPVLLTQSLAHIELDLPWRGVTLAIAAPLYIALSLLIRNARPRSIATAPTWATFSTGYALTAIGAMVSFGDERLAIYVLALNALVYAVSAYIFQQSFWLYLTTILAPIVALLTFHYTNHFETNLVAWTFIAFAFVYLGIGQLFDRNRDTTLMSLLRKSDINVTISKFAAPFYVPAFLLSAIALALVSNERILAIQIYATGVILYALSSVLFKETLFLYPAAWLAAVPYYLAITLTSLETRWYGLAWLPLIILYIGLGRFVFHKRQLAPLGKGFLADWLTHPAVPFYLLAYALSISMISLSYATPLSLTIAFGVAAVIYFVSAHLFKTPAWIYPALFTAHMTVLAYFTIDPSGGPKRYITIPFLAMTWLTSLIGYLFERRTQLTDENKSYRHSILNRLFGHAWARPFFAFVIVEMVIWQSLALTGSDTTIIIGSGYALLFALFSLLWTEGTLVYGAVAFGLVAAGGSLNQAEVKFADAVAIYGGIGFGLYLFGRILDSLSARLKSLTVWLTPLTHSSITLTALAVVINLPTVTTHMTATAATFAFAGALYVAIAYRGRMYRLGYLGMALLELAWVLALVINDVAQPQWYAIPGGLYFAALGFLEWRRNKSRYAIALEILGLGLLLVTSFAQSLNGKDGLPYFVLLLVEGLIVIWWGVYQKRKIPFFTGIGASAINMVAQVIVLVSVYDINRWLVAFGAGLLIMAIAIYIERSRERLRERTRELSETLEKWE